MNKIRLYAGKLLPQKLRRPRVRIGAAFVLAASAYALQGGNDPWDNAVSVLKTAFTGPIATGLSLVAIVVGGLMFAFGEGQSKRRRISGVLVRAPRKRNSASYADQSNQCWLPRGTMRRPNGREE